MKDTRYPVKAALFMTAYYTANSVYQSYMSLYYTAVRLSSARIGMINAFVALASLAGQPLWGVLGDRTSGRRRLIALLSLISGAVSLGFLASTRFLPLMLLAGVFAFFYTAIQPMGDSVILDRLNENNHPYGPLRLCGCLAFAVSGLVSGRFLGVPGREKLIPPVTAILCVLTAASTLSLPVCPGGRSVSRRVSVKALAGHRELIRLLLLMAPVQITMGYFYTFFSPHFMSLEGADGARLGACYLISAASEIPFLLMADRLFDRFGAGKLMLTAALSLSARWLLLALGRSAGAAMVSQVFHGWGFIVMTVCMAKYISRTVPQSLQATGQMLLAVVSFGIARVIGNLGGGFLANAMGRQNVFFICAAICLCAFIAFAPKYLNRPPLNGQSSRR